MCVLVVYRCYQSPDVSLLPQNIVVILILSRPRFCKSRCFGWIIIYGSTFHVGFARTHLIRCWVAASALSGTKGNLVTGNVIFSSLVFFRGEVVVVFSWVFLRMVVESRLTINLFRRIQNRIGTSFPYIFLTILYRAIFFP